MSSAGSDNIYLIGLLGKLNEFIHVKLLEHLLAHIKHLICCLFLSGGDVILFYLLLCLFIFIIIIMFIYFIVSCSQSSVYVKNT